MKIMLSAALLAALIAPVRAEDKPASGGAVTIKDLLKDVSAEMRAEFAGGLTLAEGRVMSAGFSALKGLPEEKLTAVKNSFASKKAPRRKPEKRGKLAKLSELLRGVPKPVADEFMDSLVFIDGRVAGAVTGGLKKGVTPERYKEILDSLAAPGTKAPAGMKGVCGNGWCDDSACVSRGNERRHCESQNDSTCYSSCR